MIARDDFDRLMTVWFDETAGSGVPDYLDETLNGLSRIGQRSAWMSPGRWLPVQLTMPRVAMPRALPILALIALLAIALIAAALFVGSRRPSLPPPFGRAATGDLAFDRDGDIFLSDLDGTDVRPLVAGPAKTFGPTWSRDGTRLAYWSVAPGATKAHLRIVDADGRNDRDGANGREFEANTTFSAVEWGPTSDAFAFTDGADGGALYVGGGSVQGLKQYGDPGVDYALPSWSPRGDLIAVVGSVNATSQAVYVIHRDGTGLEHVADLPFEIGSLLSWSRDGRRIIYHAAGDIVVSELDDAGRWTTRVLVGGGEADAFPSWSNDGQRLAFLRSDGGAAGDNGHILVADADGRGAHAIGSSLIGWAPFCWSPDDRSIRAIVTDDPSKAFDEIPRPRYALLSVDRTEPDVEVDAPGMLTFAACSWQRLGT